MNRWIGIVVMCICMISFSLPCLAQSGDDQSYKEETTEKISRGLANILSSFGEIPKGIADSTEDVEYPVYETFEGLFTGVGKTVVRLMSGIYDIVVAAIPNAKTFPPDPERLGSTQ